MDIKSFLIFIAFSTVIVSWLVLNTSNGSQKEASIPAIEIIDLPSPADLLDSDKEINELIKIAKLNNAY